MLSTPKKKKKSFARGGLLLYPPPPFFPPLTALTHLATQLLASHLGWVDLEAYVNFSNNLDQWPLDRQTGIQQATALLRLLVQLYRGVQN